jgi:hypothetical protein
MKIPPKQAGLVFVGRVGSIFLSIGQGISSLSA